jgi:hypothetical protein
MTPTGGALVSTLTGRLPYTFDRSEEDHIVGPRYCRNHPRFYAARGKDLSLRGVTERVVSLFAMGVAGKRLEGIVHETVPLPAKVHTGV